MNVWLDKFFPTENDLIEDVPQENSDDDLAILYHQSHKKPKNSRFNPELELFLNVSSTLTGEDFWNSHENEFPNLFKIYSKLKSIQSTSASVERLFSLAKLVYDDLAANIDVETIFYKLVLKK